MNLLRIERLRADYLVASRDPGLLRVKSGLDAALTSDLAHELSSRRLPWMSEEDGSIWFIRRLDIGVDLAANRIRDHLARAVALQINRALARILDDGADSENAIRFSDRNAYVAQFLLDTANGSRHGRWYYQPFAGLSMLPASATLRTVLCEEPSVGIAALRGLTPAEVRLVAVALSPEDARRVVDALGTDGSETGARVSVQEIWAAWHRLHLDEEADERRAALRLLVEAGGRADGGEPLRKEVLAVVRWGMIVRAASAAESEALRRALADGDLARLDFLGGADADTLAPLLGSLAPVSRTAADAPTPAGDAGPLFTSHGGVFLLLPLLEEVPLEETADGWPPLGTVSAAAAARFLVLVKCCGGRRMLAALDDALLRKLAGVQAQLTTGDLVDWQRQIPAASSPAFDISPADAAFLRLPEPLLAPSAVDSVLSGLAADLLRGLARRLPGFAGSHFEHLFANFLDVEATMEDEPSRRIVRIGRPPLHLVLSMTGRLRLTYRLSWLDERPFVLFPSESP